MNVTCAGDTAGGQALVLCLCALSIHFSLLSLWKGMLWRSTYLSAAHLCCSMVLRTCRWSTNTLNFSVLLPSFQAAADFQLHVSCPLGFLSKWDSWPRQAPPSVISTWKCQVEAQRSLWCLHHCSLWCSSLYLLCFFGRLDSLDLQCFSGRVGKVIRECLTDLEH